MKVKKRKVRIPGDRVLIKIKKDIIDDQFKYNKSTGVYEEYSKQGFLIKTYSKDEVDSMRLGTQEGTVVAIGEDAYKGIGSGRPWIKIGEDISINRWSGELLPELGDKEIYRLLSDSDVLWIWDGFEEVEINE